MTPTTPTGALRTSEVRSIHDTPEYLEGMVGAYKARVAPFNVNYRYVADELRFVLARGNARGVVYHGAFTARLAEVLPELPGVDVLIRVEDGSGYPLLPGAVDYEDVLREAAPGRPPLPWSPDDLYVLFTGGTTGRPKDVLWRQADILVAGMTIVADKGAPWASLEELVAGAVGPAAAGRILVAAPLMHASGQWAALWAVLGGGTAVLPTTPDRRDPVDLLSVMERELVGLVSIVRDAFARPLVDELRRRSGRGSPDQPVASRSRPSQPPRSHQPGSYDRQGEVAHRRPRLCITGRYEARSLQVGEAGGGCLRSGP